MGFSQKLFCATCCVCIRRRTSVASAPSCWRRWAMSQAPGWVAVDPALWPLSRCGLGAESECNAQSEN